jgi:dipeptidyl aminopeptidase/acylaminoacyl peptidase
MARRRTRIIRAAGVAAVLALASASAPNLAAGLSFADLPKLVALSAPQISPDGRSIVVVVRRADYEHDRNERALDVVDVATGRHCALTVWRKGVSSPAWSPEGDRLAFLADVDDKSQIFVMPVNGGDAARVTNAPEGVEQFAWRPDGSAFAYVAVDEAPKGKGADQYRDAFKVANNDYLTRRAARPGHIYLVDATGGRPRRLTRGAWSVLVGESSSTLSWSHDGKTIAFGRAANAITDTEDFSTAWVADAATGATRPLTRHTAEERDPFSLPTAPAALTYCEGDSQVNPRELYLTAPSGGAETNLTRAVDRAVGDFAWLPDNSALYVAVNDGTTNAVFRVPVEGKAARVDLDDVAIESSLDGAVAKDGGIAFVGTTSAWPQEVYYAAPSEAPRRLTDYNEAIERVVFPRAKRSTTKGPTASTRTPW